MFEYIILMTCFCIIILKEITGKPSEPIVLYLHTEATTWNEANHICMQEKSRLVTLKDDSKVQTIQAVVKEWKEQNLINDDLWMGMFYTDSGRYNWTDCSSLGTWTLWYFGEPNFRTQHRCIRVDRNYLSWKTINCARSYQFICEKALEKCWYDTFTNKRITGKLFSAGFTTNLAGCEELCLTTYMPKSECVAFTFTENNACLLLMRDEPYLESEPIPVMEFKLSSVSAIKRCFFYDHSTQHSVATYTDTNDFPNYTCSATSNPANISSSPTPVTPTTASSQSSTSGCSCDCHLLTATTESPSVPSTDVPTELPAQTNHSTPVIISESVSVSQPVVVSAGNISVDVVSTPVFVTLDDASSVRETSISPTPEVSPSASEVDSQLESTTPTMACASWVDLQTSMTEPLLTTSSVFNTEQSSTLMTETSVVKYGTTSYTDGLALNRTSLSSYRRKMTSAVDTRTSAVVIGSVGCVNIALFFVVILLLDGTNIIQLIEHIANNWSK